MSQKPVFKTRTQLVEEAIRTQILKGELKTGQPLRQDALAKEFNVSRIPVREALVQLEAQGLVSFEPHKGATVTVNCLQIKSMSYLNCVRLWNATSWNVRFKT